MKFFWLKNGSGFSVDYVSLLIPTGQMGVKQHRVGFKEPEAYWELDDDDWSRLMEVLRAMDAEQAEPEWPNHPGGSRCCSRRGKDDHVLRRLDFALRRVSLRLRVGWKEASVKPWYEIRAVDALGDWTRVESDFTSRRDAEECLREELNQDHLLNTTLLLIRLEVIKEVRVLEP